MMNMKTQNGFTLIELMITLILAAILLTVAVPGFRSVIQNNRATTEANALHTAMMLARSESINRRIPVSVCSSNATQTACAGSTNWANGWIVFTDDSGTAGTLDGSDVLLRVWNTPKGNPTIIQTVGGDDVQYTSTGLAATAATITLTMPDCKGDQVRTISVSATGRASVATSACPS